MEYAVSAPEFHCGFVTLIGQPNVGKSTLLNRILGQKLAITSSRPQTTRNRIPGILTRPNAQIIFIDTPGVHHASRALNQHMVDVATGSIGDTDAVALIVEAGVGRDGAVGISPTARELLTLAGQAGKKVFLVINKIDQLPREQVLPVIDAWRTEHDFEAIVPVSALKGDGVDRLVGVLAGAMPPGPALYPEDTLTELPERFFAAELVREKLFRQLGQELPYSVAVTIESWRDRAEDGVTEIAAVIHVERESQKAIVIGRGGQMLKQIGTSARLDLERLLDTRVHLSLFVRVDKGWTRSPGALKRLGYAKP
ncbi:MAG: GTPase Era [Myxococcales bacterium]|nr:GTPase Era [Myxococcales bacterium]